MMMGRSPLRVCATRHRGRGLAMPAGGYSADAVNVLQSRVLPDS